jgi:UDP-N-acetylmuramoyl-tripeptide--D-alanyl-D-alanine ligase
MKSLFKRIITAIISWQAERVIKKYDPKIVCITGSVGKTSTKDAIYTVLASSFYVRKSEKSFNSEIGVPLTILGCPNGWANPTLWVKNILRGFSLILFTHKYPHWLVLEVGADRPGDIAQLMKWLHPDISVVTKLAKIPVHVEFFASPEAVIEEKANLAKGVKENGILILNRDDEDVAAFRKYSRGQVLFFGTKRGSDFKASPPVFVYDEVGDPVFPKGVSFHVDHAGNSVPIVCHGALGNHYIYPLLAAIAVGSSQGISLVQMAEAIALHTPARGRMRLIEGIKNTMIIDDSYNSSPVALAEALKTLAAVEGSGKKVAVLGDMLELGKYSVDEHKKAGQYAAGIADILVTVGIRSRAMAETAIDILGEDSVLQFEDSREAGKYLEQIIKKGDIILVKGSQSIRMERTVEELMAHPEKAHELLVRQDREWLNR